MSFVRYIGFTANAQTVGNPQKTKFKTIDAFFDSLPESESKIVERLRALVLDCIPDCREKLAYNVPFYYRHARIAYIWPASVPWGGVAEGVALGFCQGSRLEGADPAEPGHTLITKHVFTHVSQIDAGMLRQLLYEAALLDRLDAQAKRKPRS